MDPARVEGDPDRTEAALHLLKRPRRAPAGGGGSAGVASEDARVPGLPEADGTLDVGVGMRPDLVGRGLGPEFATTVLDFAAGRGATTLRAVVQAWNTRSLRLVERLGVVRTGTHDGGGVVDISVDGMSSSTRTSVARALRQVGFAAWVRNPNQGDWPWHIHAAAISDTDLSTQAQHQTGDYYLGLNGLANQAADDGPRIPIQTWEEYQRTH